MKILVAVKRVIDYNVHIRVKTDQSGVETENVKMSINPFDEIAVEAAVLLKEAGQASEVVVVSIGTQQAQESLRTALAMGADRALHIQTDSEIQALAVAQLLAAVAKKEEPRLFFLGKQAIDDDSNQTGQMLAALLDWPQGTFVSQIESGDGSVRVVREIDGGLETLNLKLPAVITVDLRLNQPRYVKLPEIMKARRKPLDTLTPEELQVDIKPRLEIIKVEEPPVRNGGIKVAGVAELIDKLRNEAGIL